MKSETWDVICSREDPDSLWFGYRIASALVERQQQVRLFTDQIRELSIAVERVEPHLWLQAHAGMELVDRRIARYIAPAERLVQVCGVPLSRAYLTRFISQPSRAHWFDVSPAWDETAPGAPIQLLERTSSYCRYSVAMGDAPKGGGFVRSQPASPGGERRGPAWLRHARAGVLNLLGLTQDALDHDCFLYVDGRIGEAFESWVKALADSEVASCVFVGDGPLQQLLARRLPLRPGVVGTARVGQLTVGFLPPLTWIMEDELFNISDVVLAASSQCALRATECGAPAVVSADAGQPGRFLRWYAAQQRSEPVNTWNGLSESLHTGLFAATYWSRFLTQRNEFRALAHEAQDRIVRAPEVIDLLVASALRDDADGVDRFFASTQPVESMLH